MPMTNEIGRGARRLLLMPMAGWLVMAAGGGLPTQYLGGRSGIEAMVTAQAVVVAVVYTTLLPAMRQMLYADAKARFRIALKAGTTRFILTVLISGVIAWRWLAEPNAFLIWVAIAYVLMIKVETLTLIWWAKKIESQQ